MRWRVGMLLLRVARLLTRQRDRPQQLPDRLPDREIEWWKARDNGRFDEP